MAWHWQGALRTNRVDALALGVAYVTDQLNPSQFEASKSISREAYVRMIDHLEAGIPPGSRTSCCWGTPGSSWRSGQGGKSRLKIGRGGERHVSKQHRSSPEPPRSPREELPGHRVRGPAALEGPFRASQGHAKETRTTSRRVLRVYHLETTRHGRGVALLLSISQSLIDTKPVRLRVFRALHSQRDKAKPRPPGSKGWNARSDPFPTDQPSLKSSHRYAGDFGRKMRMVYVYCRSSRSPPMGWAALEMSRDLTRG